MNYKHQYHFGNFADIFKHIILTVSLEEFVKNKDYMEMISNEMMAQLPETVEHSFYGGEFDLSDFELIQETNGSISEKMHTKPEWKGKDATFALKILGARKNMYGWFNRQRNQLILFSTILILQSHLRK